MKCLKRLTTSLSLVLFLAASLPGVALADETNVDTGSGGATVIFDLLILRPVGFIATVAGTAFYIITAPFTLPTGNIKTSYRNLVEAPAAYTFTRGLGEEI
jgi:hypothetical protein